MIKSKIIKKVLFGIRAVMGTLLVKEIFMGEKFKSTIADSEWFKYRSVSPGGYAVDYAFFYVLYRVLSSVKPQNCLEFGLGQTSKMLHQYANYYNAKAVTIEHDEDWTRFFNESREGDYPINVRMFELEDTEYKGNEISTYKDCTDILRKENERYDFVLVDGGPYLRNPKNNRKYKYARTHVIDIAKYCLKDNFVIMFDDYNNDGVRNTVKEIFDYFHQKGIQYVYREYSGAKYHVLITTPSYRFLTTL